MRSWYEKPQSSSSHRLNARSVATVAGMSSRSACSMPHRERREQQDAFEALLVHHREPRVAVLVLGAQRFDLHERARVDALGDLAAEHEVHAAGHDDRVERRVGDELEQLAPDEQERVRALLHDLDAALAELLVEVTGARVDGLVVVVVGVDGPVSDVHGPSPFVGATPHDWRQML